MNNQLEKSIEIKPLENKKKIAILNALSHSYPLHIFHLESLELDCGQEKKYRLFL